MIGGRLTEVLIVVTIALVGASAFVFLEFDEQPAEYEVIVEIDADNRVWLKPWVGCTDPESVKIDVTDDENFDWHGFAEKHINSQIYKNEAKVDIWDQLEWQWDKFIDYVWTTRLKYERDHPKFHVK